MAYTEDLSKFGQRERSMLAEILHQSLPGSFRDDEVRPAMNTNSGYVFLVNSDYQIAMMNGDKLAVFYSTPYNGLEGFIEELLEEDPKEIHPDDAEYILCMAKEENAELPEAWQNYGED